jgi:hypothetical protein
MTRRQRGRSWLTSASMVALTAASGGGLVTGSFWWDLTISVLAALVLAWLALVIIDDLASAQRAVA